jgi:iron complex outermembrane recepter protein
VFPLADQRRGGLLAAAFALSIVSRAAQAQETDDDVHHEDVLEIVVESSSSEPHSTTVLDERTLDRSAGDDLAETLSDVPGVTAARGTSDATKLVIRGQIERRLLVLLDGVRHEAQKWGADHATEIDPFAAGSIQVIRGAAGVRYGPDAIGGVVLVEPVPLRAERGWDGKAELVGATNGLRAAGAARIDLSPADGLALRLEGNYARGGVVSAPDYPLGNTASETWNAGITGGWSHGERSLRLTLRHYDLRAGVCFCVRSESGEDFLAALEADAPLGADRWTRGFDIERPYQDVAHDVVMARYRDALGDFGYFSATYAFQNDHRQEFDQVRSSVTGPQYDFLLRTHTLDLLATRNQGRLGPWTLEGGVGASLLFQEHVYNGLTLIPNHRALTGGLFAWEHWSNGPVHAEVGGRLDTAGRSVFLSPSVYAADLARGVLAAGDCVEGPDASRCDHRWTSGSASAGAVWRVVPERLDLRLDLSSASRFPSPDELYSNGTAPTLPVYAVGDPSLRTETTWGANPTVTLDLPALHAELSAYANRTDRFVLFAPELDADGEILFDVTIQGAFPRFSYRAVDAQFTGMDGEVAVRLARTLSAGVQGALVHGIDLATRAPLPFVPPDRVRGTVAYSSVRQHGSAELNVDWLGRARTSPADLAPAPDPAVLVGGRVGTDVHVGDRDLSVSLEVHNALNTRYRDATSLPRYYADEPGRQFQLRLSSSL